jgi:uncharacterized protein (TIGR02001 family)
MRRKSALLPPRAVAGPALYAVLGALQCAVAGERWHLSALAASDYVHRGLSQSDNRPALQAGASYRFVSGVYAGVWGSTVSNARTPFPDAAGRFEVSYMAGYAMALGDSWDFDVALFRYEYPDSDAVVSYGYTELAASLGFDDRLRLTLATSRDATIYTRSGLAHDITTYAWELTGRHPLGARLSGLAGVGYLDFRNGADTGYTYFNVGLAARLANMDLEMQYFDTRNGEQLFGRRLAGPRVVLALMVRF